ncbi:MAG: poly-beta-1,6-N-acetyl-D-glucosamine N-deacetylase PgaB [Lentisphaerae bacterium GWF2_52_8]|nr:MAG: poly-beta-1,6-N-acetyl-D-glucosamine N-deacetylase PgaB [Lentisphaerae bacterium GWF2_52_8]
MGAEGEQASASWGGDKFMVLCYHDVPVRLSEDKYGVDIFSLVKQIEFMRDYGCHFISVDDVLAASRGEKALPDKAVLMTFDDAYESFYKDVFPLLKLYNIPCVLAVVPSWILAVPQDDPEYKTHVYLQKSQLKELSESGLVEIASHSFNSHRGVLCNPQGNTAPAIIARIYDPQTKLYEDNESYRKRLHEDFEKSRDFLAEATGKAPRIMVWPYGRYTGPAIEEAKKSGFQLMFTLDDGLADAKRSISAIPRHMVVENPSIGMFADAFKKGFFMPTRLRILQADLDLIYDGNPAEQEKNLDKFIERVYRLKPSTVYLQAFCDDGADGNIKSVYFPNRVLPMKADLFSRVSRCLSIRGIQVYAWLPMLSICLPDEKENERLRVREFRDDEIRQATSWYQRLSPFSPGTAEKLGMLYEDLAIHSIIDGIIFQDDGYLNDYEDYSSDALAAYKKDVRPDLVPFAKLSDEEKKKWTELKTDKLMELTEYLKKKVLAQRPTAVFARTIYAPVLLNPDSEEWFAQNYKKCLSAYDHTVVMSYPRMEKVYFAESWLRSLVRKAREYPLGLQKTVFKTQAYDWEAKKWIKDDTLVSWLRVLLAEGAEHIAYYPDDYTVDKPGMKSIINIISSQDFPEQKRSRSGLYP